MYLRDLGGSLLRRWYFVVAALGLTAGLSFAAFNLVSPTYDAKSSLVLVPPATSIGESGNPYLFLGGLEQSVDVLTRALSAESTRRQVAKTAKTGEYEVVADFATSAPIVLIKATDGSSDGAQRLLDSVEEQVPLTLQNLQRSLGVQTKAQITSMVVTSDDKPEAVQKARYRTIALVALVTLFLSALGIGFLDGLLLLRRIRMGESALPDGDDLDGVNPDDDLAALERDLQDSSTSNSSKTSSQSKKSTGKVRR